MPRTRLALCWPIRIRARARALQHTKSRLRTPASLTWESAGGRHLGFPPSFVFTLRSVAAPLLAIKRLGASRRRRNGVPPPPPSSQPRGAWPDEVHGGVQPPSGHRASVQRLSPEYMKYLPAWVGLKTIPRRLNFSYFIPKGAFFLD